MATTEYKRMDYDQLLYFTQYLLAKLKASPLATDHTYTIAISGRTVTLTDNNGAAQAIGIPLPEDASETTAGLMTAALYTKLMSIEASAEKNVISKITVNGETVDPADGTVAITTPTKTSELTNDSNYQTADEVLATVTGAVGKITGIDFDIVDALPETGTKGIIYLISNGSSEAQNIYDEYIWITKKDGTSSYEHIGSTKTDLTGYVKAEEMKTITNTEITTAVDSAYSTVFSA